MRNRRLIQYTFPKGSRTDNKTLTVPGYEYDGLVVTPASSFQDPSNDETFRTAKYKHPQTWYVVHGQSGFGILPDPGRYGNGVSLRLAGYLASAFSRLIDWSQDPSSVCKQMMALDEKLRYFMKQWLAQKN